MNWISWVIIAILAAASGVVAYCWRKGYIKADSAVRILATVYSAVVDASSTGAPSRLVRRRRPTSLPSSTASASSTRTAFSVL